jgi:cellulose synthase/poly-beta-1,6-N-acetylglucosamine synthase-like glycosyltransferase
VYAISAFLFIAALIAYTVAGYPLLLGWIARRSGRAVEKGQEVSRSVTVIVAVYNGENFIADKLESILQQSYPADRMQVLVVSDGSTDQTDTIAQGFSSRGVEVLRVPRGGKPAALNAAVPSARGEILLLTDVRQVLEPETLARLMACFADSSVGVVSGDMVVRSGNREESNVGLYWRYERWIRKQLAAVDSMMGATGPLYAIRKDLFRPMPPETLLDDMYIPLGAFFQGYRLVLEEQAKAYDYPTNIGTEFRRKVRTLAGNYQIIRQFPQLLSFRNRMLLHYVSYKLGRLLLPWMFLGLLVVSFLLPWPLSAIAVSAQVLIGLLAATDFVTAPDSFWKRISSPLRTVVTMLAASACAVAIFFVPPQKLWKPTQLQVRR